MFVDYCDHGVSLGYYQRTWRLWPIEWDAGARACVRACVRASQKPLDFYEIRCDKQWRRNFGTVSQISSRLLRSA
jgi:hypothetical protein